jgi:lysophospholipase L1-like esterase
MFKTEVFGFVFVILNSMRVLVFGDSITYGAWDTEAGWVERIKRMAHQQTVQAEGKTKLQIINLGIGGDTSTKILKRMPAEIEARYSASWPFIFVITFGTNDERRIDGNVETPIEKFKTNVQAIIELAKQHSDKILFLGIPPIGKPVVEFKGQEYSDERVKQYEHIMQTIVEAAGLPFVTLRKSFEDTLPEALYSYDLIHPNDAGHQLIASIVEPEINKLLV